MNLKLSLLLSLYCTTAFHHSYGMEKDEIYQKPSGTKQDSDNASMNINNHHSNTSLDDSGLLVKAGLSNMMSSEILQKIKDLYYGKLRNLDIDPLQIPNYKELCLEGENQGYWQYFLIYQNLIGQYQDIIDHIKQRADQGYAEAQNNLGVMYCAGQGVEKDDKEAVNWFKEAAEQGHAPAQCNLGGMYRNGRGVKQNDAEAVKWYRLAANQGNAGAQNNLGYMYQNGRGVEKDDKEAVNWYRLAADQRYASAQHNLGYMYRNGRGVKQNDAEAVKWFRLAADQGFAAAQGNLGYMYQNGHGVGKDDKEAVKWYRLAADQGYAAAQHNLKTIVLQNMDSLLNHPLLVSHIQILCDGYNLISDMGLKPEQVLSSFQKIITKISSSLPSDLIDHYEVFFGAIDDIKKSVGPFKKQDKKTVGKIEEKIKALLDKAAQQKKAEDARVEQQRKQKEQEEKAALKQAKEQEKAQKKREEKEKTKALKEQAQVSSVVAPKILSVPVMDLVLDVQPLPETPSDIVPADSSPSSIAQTMSVVSAVESPIISRSSSSVVEHEVTKKTKDKQALREEKKHRKALERTLSLSSIGRAPSSYYPSLFMKVCKL